MVIETNIPTVLRNIKWLAIACRDYHDKHARQLKTKFLECDELTSYIYAKEQNLPAGLKGFSEAGDMWTWCGLCTESRFMISWRIGKHLMSDAVTFTDDLASRIPGKVQIHTDQLGVYRPAFETSFGDRADYATTRKSMEDADKTPDGLFQQQEFVEARKRSEWGNPDMTKVTTNHVERANNTTRTWNRNYTRRTIAFAKLLANAEQRLALNYFYYNFVHQHSALDGITPAMAVGVTDRLWSIRDMVGLVNKSNSL